MFRIPNDSEPHPETALPSEAAPQPVGISTITVKIVHMSNGQTAFETFWAGPIVPAGVTQVLRQAADTIDQQRSPLFLPPRH